MKRVTIGSRRRGARCRGVRGIRVALLLAAVVTAPVGSNGWEHQAIPLPVLLRALHSDIPEYRARAAVSLGIKGNRSAIPELLAALEASEPALQVRAVIYRALGRIGGPQVANVLVAALLKETLPEVRAEAALALGDLGDPATREALLAALKRDRAPAVRTAVVSALGAFRDRSSVDALAGVLNGADPALMRRVARSLGRTRSEAAVAPLLALLKETSDEGVRVAAVKALAGIGSPRSREALEGLLADSQPEALRIHAVIALGAVRDGSSVPTLVELMGDGSPEQRYFAITSLIELGDPTAASAIAAFYDGLARNLDALSDGGYPELAWPLLAGLRLQIASLRALTELDPPQGLDAFLHGARSRTFPRDTAVGLQLNTLAHEARRLAVSGLGYAGSDRAVEVLTESSVWQAPDPRIRSAATRALAVAGYQDALEYLAARVTDPDPEVRWTAAAALGRLGRAGAIDPLRGLLGDPHSEVRLQAVLSLGLLNGAELGTQLEGLAGGDASPRVRAAATATLALLSGANSARE